MRVTVRTGRPGAYSSARHRKSRPLAGGGATEHQSARRRRAPARLGRGTFIRTKGTSGAGRLRVGRIQIGRPSGLITALQLSLPRPRALQATLVYDTTAATAAVRGPTADQSRACPSVRPGRVSGWSSVLEARGGLSVDRRRTRRLDDGLW